MKIIDAHCDALSKLYLNPQLDFFKSEKNLDVDFNKMDKSGIKVQFFAIYLPEKIQQPTFHHILQFIDIFYQKIIKSNKMHFIRHSKDLEKVMLGQKIGALLTLEGADGIMGDMLNLRILYYLGVRCIGITWNYSNWAADGVMEPRKGGFTLKGRRMIKECNELGILLDVSHLSMSGFWELLESTETPFIASHSNALELCTHPRNLSDDQIEAVIRRKGQIGLTFVPWFVDSSSSPVKVSALLKHLDHVCSLGGSHYVGFGSDFDGIDQWIEGLEHAGKYDTLINELCKHYKQDEVDRFLYKNWHHFLLTNLPKE